MENKELVEAKRAQAMKDKKKNKEDEDNEESFKKELTQGIIVNGTLQGMEDVLAIKHEKGAVPSILFPCDELSVLGAIN